MKKRRIGRIVWGIALVIVGVIFALNVLGITEIKIFFDGWWALFIIVPSFVSCPRHLRKTSRKQSQRAHNRVLLY
jgi:hypothetical protein